MAIGYGEPAPKPIKGSNRRSRRSTRNALAKKFRDIVWARQMTDEGAFCQRCGAGPLLRTRDFLRRDAGHVAHLRGRNVMPWDIVNPDAAELLCRPCHLGGDHGMRF